VTSEAILLEFSKFTKSRQNAYRGLVENVEGIHRYGGKC
jgi:hypothetical protein